MFLEGGLGGSDGSLFAFSSGSKLGVLALSPMSGSLLSRESASPFPSALPPAHALSLSLKYYSAMGNEDREVIASVQVRGRGELE